MSRHRILVAAALAGLLAGLARAGEPASAPAKPVEPTFADEVLEGKAGETIWYRFKAGQPHVVILVQAVLGRHGLAHGTHYWLDRRDDVGLVAVTGAPKWIALVRSLLGFLEEDQPQVRVRTRVVETVLNRDLQAGVEADLERKNTSDTFFRGFRVDHEPKSYLDSTLSTQIPFTGSTLGFGTYEGVDSAGNFVSKTREHMGSVRFALRALGERQSSEILAQPDQVVLSGTKAVFEVKKKYPIQNVQIAGNNANVTVIEKDLGFKMDVTPHILGDRRISLAVNAEVSNLAGYVEVGPGTKYPYISTRRVNTTVIVLSGYEVVIGGLFQTERSVVEKGVPLISEIPLIGYLFKSYWSVQNRKELVFFIQPTIVEPRARLFAPAID